MFRYNGRIPLYFWLFFLSCVCYAFVHIMVICALWSPAGKRLTHWLSLVVSKCEFVTFSFVSWVRCGTLLYRFLIFEPLLTFLSIKLGISKTMSDTMLLVICQILSHSIQCIFNSFIRIKKEYRSCWERANLLAVLFVEFCHFPKWVLVHIRIKGEVGAIKLV